MTLSFLLPLGLALITFHVGLGLTGRDFARLAMEPRAVGAGLAAQMLALPALALLLVAVWPLAPELAIGIMLIAAAPGGATSNLLTLLAGGDVALAVTITAISTIASAFTLPLFAELTAALTSQPVSPITMPVGLMIRSMLISVVLPLLAGMTMRQFASRLASAIEPRLRAISIGVFGAIVLYTFVSNAPAFQAHGLTVGPAMLALNIAAMIMALLIARGVRVPRRQAIAIMFETGLQNAAVAIIVALSVLQRPELAIPAVIYALCMNIGALGGLPLARRWLRQPSSPGSLDPHLSRTSP